MKKIFIIIIILFSKISFAIDVDDAIKSTIENNPKVKIAFEKLEESKELIENAYNQKLPTTPASSPTITIAEKLKCLPPFVTFVTRLIATNLSFNSISVALTFFPDCTIFNYIKILNRFHELIQPMLLHDRDINIHFYQKQLQ